MESTSNVVDRISNLPEGIIHYIFSFLETKAIVQASILSTNKWRYMWMTSPFLNFNLDSCKKRKKLRFINFVDRVLLFRGSSTIYTFNLTCREELRTDRISTWLMTVLRRGVHELSLDLDLDCLFQLPHNLFTSSIKVMKLRTVLGRFVLPSSVCSNSRITSLQLTGVELPEGNADGDLKFSFMVLKNFILCRCTCRNLNSFTLFAPQLERFEVINIFGVRSAPNKINICTPKLRSFIYTGAMYGDYFHENLLELVSADIYVLQMHLQPKKIYTQHVNNLLTAICNVKKLTIPNTLLQTSAGSLFMETIANSFHNLRIIRLVEWTSSCIKTIIRFLERLPLIETVILSIASKCSQVSDLGTIDELDCVSNSSMKTIKIVSCSGDEQELKLLEILLKKSLVLKEVIIRKPRFPELDVLVFRKFRKKLSKLPRASSSVSILYRD